MNTNDTIQTQIEAFNRHDATAFAACYAADAVVADPQALKPLAGTQAIARDVGDWFNSFPDVEARLLRTVVNGTDYAVEWSMSGTHKGPLTTPEGHVPATDRRIDVVIVTIGRTGPDGSIVEERRAYDLAGVMNQLGLMQ